MFEEAVGLRRNMQRANDQIRQLTNGFAVSVDEILVGACDRVLEAWRGGSNGEPVLRDTVLSAVAEAVRAVRQATDDAQASITGRGAIGDAARARRIPMGCASSILDLRPLALRAAVVARPFATHRLRRIRNPLAAAFQEHAERLRLWASASLGQLTELDAADQRPSDDDSGSDELRRLRALLDDGSSIS
jgi:hypothetical protein